MSGLARGVFEGVTGVVSQPVRGAQEEGMQGLLEGVVRGLVGVVAKPVAGVFDLASETTAAFKYAYPMLYPASRLCSPEKLTFATRI